MISFKTAKSCEDVLAGDVSAGDHAAGRVLYLLDSFTSMQTWTENRTNNSRTPKKPPPDTTSCPAGGAAWG